MAIVLNNYQGIYSTISSIDEQIIFSINSEACNTIKGIWIDLKNIINDVEIILKYNDNIFYNKIIKKEDNRLLLIPGDIPVNGILNIFIKYNELIEQTQEINYQYFIEGFGIGHLWEYYLTEANTGLPIQGANITVCLDTAGKAIVAKGITDSAGKISCYLDPGSYFIFRNKSGFIFEDPEIENVS